MKVKTNTLFGSLPHTLKDMYYTFLALLIGIFFHELGHFVSAAYYGLNPKLGISSSGVFILADSASRYVEEVIINSGVIANLLVVFIFIIIFFIREKRCTRHNLSCFFILLVILANLLIALISLMLFPFTLLL